MLPSFGTSPSLALSSQNFTHPRPGCRPYHLGAPHPTTCDTTKSQADKQSETVCPTPYHSGTPMAQNRQNSPGPLPAPLSKDPGEKKGHLQK